MKTQLYIPWYKCCRTLLTVLIVLGMLVPSAPRVVRAEESLPDLMDTMEPDFFRGKIGATTPPDFAEPFDVTLVISPLEDALATQVRFFLPESVKLVSGELDRTMDITEDEVITRTITVRVIENGQWEIRAWVHTSDVGTHTMSYRLYLQAQQDKLRLLQDGPTHSAMTPLVSQEIKPDDTWSPPQNSQVAAGTVSLTGRFLYDDPEDNSRKPARWNDIRVYETHWYGDTEIGRSWTDGQGYYSVNLNFSGRKNLYVRVYTESNRVKVTDGTDVWYGQTEQCEVSSSDSDTWDLGWRYFDSSDANSPVQIHDYVHNETEWIAERTGGWYRSQITVKWPVGDWPVFRSNSSGSSWIELPHHSTWNWQAKTVYHEFAHAVMWSAYRDKGKSMPSGWGPDPHHIHSVSSEGFALTEGWAEFMAAAVSGNSDANYDYAPSCSHGGNNTETNWWWRGDTCSNTNGNNVEGAAASVLWDIFDSPASDDDRLALGFSNLNGSIWRVLKDDTPTSMTDFWAKWFQHYGYQSEMCSVYFTYGINQDTTEQCDNLLLLYRNAGFDGDAEDYGRGRLSRSGIGWQNVDGGLDNQASSVRVPAGGSVTLYEQNNRGAGWACRNSNDDNFWGDYFNNGNSLNNNVSSFELFNTSSCNVINHPPHDPTLNNPVDGYLAQDGQAPTLCWNNTGDPDGNPVQFYVEVYDSPVTANSGWISNTCWRPSALDGRYHTYKWRVKAKDDAGLQSGWSSARQFSIQSPNQSPSIAFNTANGNSASLIESREQNWTFQGTSADPDGSVNRVELRCSGDNCGSGASQASGTTSWSLARSAMAGRNDVYFQVYDNQGASATSRHLDLRIDLAAPTTGHNLIGTAGSNGWYVSSVEVRLHADDGSTGGARVGVDRVIYRQDGGAWQNRSGSDVSLVVNGDGTHTVDYYAVDRVGNAENQKQVTFKLDATRPSAPGTATEIHGALSGQWQKGVDDPSFIWGAATDTTSGIWYYRVNWNNTLQVTQGSAYDPSAVRTGSYELSVQAVDQAGNVGPVGAAFTFRYDGTPPPAPAIQNGNGVASGVWQNRIRTPNFSWPTPIDQGSGVAGYNLYWGPSANGESTTLVTSNTFVNATPICAENEAATYYLRLRTQDGVGWQSQWVGYALAYDGAPPDATLVANYGLPVAHQTSIHLDIAASDQGSGVAQMRLSNNGYNWSDWMPPATELYWEIPAIGRREHAIYLQLVDGASNVSDIISDTVYFDVNVPFPKSENFHMWDSLLAAGGGIITSTNLIQRVTIGQPSESVALQSAQYLLNPGFQAGALAAPIQVPTYTTYMQLGSLVASATTSATATTSGHFRLYGSLGQPSDMRTVTSTNFTASLGFWAGAAHDVTPEPPDPPEPPAPPECEFYSLSINNGALFTRSPLVTLNLCGPDPTQMMLSNDGGFSGAAWQPYTQTVSWTLTTYGNYVLPCLVYARYRDGSDAIHGNFFDDIIYDPSAPEGAVAFDAAALLPGMKLQAASQPLRMIQTPETELFLSFADDSSGMDEVQISLTPDFADVSWQAYAGIVPVTFTEEGVQTVYVRTRDQAGNTSAVVTDTLIVDMTPPMGNGYLPEGVVGPNTLSIPLKLVAWDRVAGVSDMRISTNANFEDTLWQPYAPEITIPLSYTEGAQTVLYMQFRDAVGNVSDTSVTPYLVDTTSPMLFVEVLPGDTLTRTLQILSHDALSQIGEMRLSNDPFLRDEVVTMPYTQTVTWRFDARRVVWVQIADSVGNFSEPFPAYAVEETVILDSKVYLPLVIRQ